jgi:hypothetical protein
LNFRASLNHTWRGKSLHALRSFLSGRLYPQIFLLQPFNFNNFLFLRVRDLTSNRRHYAIMNYLFNLTAIKKPGRTRLTC